MSTTAAPATTGHLKVIELLIKLISRVPRKYQPALIAAVLEVVLIGVLVNAVPATATEMLVGIVGLASIPIILATAQKYAIVLIGMVLLFCYLLIGRIYPEPKTGFVVARPDSSHAHPADRRVLTPEERPKDSRGTPLPHPDSVRIMGSLHFADTREAIQGAFVDVTGYSDRFDTTDSRGGFDITVPHWVVDLQHDRVLLNIQTNTGIDTASRSLAQLPFWIGMLRQPPPRVTLAPGIASRALMMAALDVSAFRRATPPPPAGDQETVLTRVVLDSLAILHDGSMAGSHWRFDLFVNAANAITVPWTSYNDRAGHNRIRLGGEVTLSLPARQHAAIRIQGLRDTWIGVRQAYGAEMVSVDSLPPNQPISRELRVSVGNDRDAGEFVFYYTLMRRGTPNIRAIRA